MNGFASGEALTVTRGRPGNSKNLHARGYDARRVGDQGQRNTPAGSAWDAERAGHATGEEFAQQVRRVHGAGQHLTLGPATGTVAHPLALFAGPDAPPHVRERLPAQVADDLAVELAGGDVAVGEQTQVRTESGTGRVWLAHLSQKPMGDAAQVVALRQPLEEAV